MTLTARETRLEVAPTSRSIRYYRVPFVDWFLSPISDDFSISLVGLPKESGGETRKIRVQIFYKTHVVEYPELALVKASRKAEYNFHEIGARLIKSENTDARYYLPSMKMANVPCRLVMLDQKKYELESQAKLIEFHEFQNFGVFEKVQTNESAVVYLDIYNSKNVHQLTVCEVVSQNSAMVQVFQELKKRLGALGINIGFGLISKGAKFAGNVVDKKHVVRDYTNLFKGVSNNLICPVLELTLSDRYLSKMLERKKVVRGTAAGRTNLGEYIQKQVMMSAPQLYSLQFRNTSFTSSMMAVDLRALTQ